MALTLSVITPAFNAVRFIDACIEHVVRQGDVVLEHIIADGGSTDGTLDRVAYWMARYPHIRLLPGPDAGQSDAMNKATAAARGDVIGILNVDDFYEPGAAAEAVAHLSRLSGPAIVCGDCRVIDADDRLVVLNRPTDLRLDALLLGWDYAQHPCNPSAYFYHREVHAMAGGYDVDEHYAMDLRFLLAAVDRVQAVYVPSLWGNFRLMPGGKTHDDERASERSKAVFNEVLGGLPRWRRIRIRLLQARIDLGRKLAARRHARTRGEARA